MIRSFVPRVVGSSNPNMPAEFDRFIRGNMDCIVPEDGRAQVDFKLGFGGLRRIEMRKIAAKHGLELDENLAGEDMKGRMEQWFLEGKFPIPEPVQMVDQAELEKRVEERLMKKLGLTPEVTDDLTDLGWAELKKVAADLDVFHVSLKRPEMEAKIREARKMVA